MMMLMSQRSIALHTWLTHTLAMHPEQYSLTALAGDASFRRYFRLSYQDQSFIIMDAPPEKESLTSFLAVGSLLATWKIYTPKVIAIENNMGFLLLEDFGDELLLHALNKCTEHHVYYHGAMDIVLQMQNIAHDNLSLAAFDMQFMLNELNIFREWFLQAYLGLTIHTYDESLLNEQFISLIQCIAAQPKVFIHRDLHSRNLMLLSNNRALGVIDFQDAMLGPFTYDLVSLLKDCYIQCSQNTISHYVQYFYKKSLYNGEYTLQQFIDAFELCGIQRHLKILGVFARLHLRDNKSAYLRYLPLTLDYIMTSLAAQPKFLPLYSWLQTHIQLPCI